MKRELSVASTYRQKRIDNRHRRIEDWLAKSGALSSEQGKSAKEISAGINEPETTIRVDLKSMTQTVAVDDTRTPYTYYLKRPGSA